MKQLKVGIDSYSLASMKMNPFDVLTWTADHNGDGVQFTGIAASHLENGEIDETFLKKLKSHADDLGLYIEWGGASHIPFDLKTGERREIADTILEKANEAATLGTGVVRSCSGGFMRWGNDLPATETLIEAMAETLKPLVPKLEDLGVTLAIETHFEFTTFELLRLFEACDAEPGGGLGICLDTMNLFTMLEDPVMGTERVLPWVVATHAKDGCIIPEENGFRIFPTEVGKGLIDWQRVITRLASLDREITLSIEDHGGSFNIPYFNPTFLSRFPDLSAQELARLQKQSFEGRTLMDDGTVAPVSREDWPQVCPDRVARDITNLKEITGMDR